MIRGFQSEVHILEPFVDRKVVLKIYHQFENNEHLILEQLKDELYFPEIYNWEIKDGKMFIYIEYIEGKKLTLPMNKNLKERLMNIYNILQKKGINHTDINPSNIIVQKGPCGGEYLKLIDFGWAYSKEYPLKHKIPSTINPGYSRDDLKSIKKIIKS